MFPPVCEPLWTRLTPEARSTWEPCCSATKFTPTPATKRANIAAKIASAFRIPRTQRPNMKTEANGISSSRNSSK